LDDGAVKLRVRAALQFGEGIRGTPAFLVSAVAGDGVVGVGHSDDARAKRNALARERVRIAGAVKEFVMMQNHLADARQRREWIENLRAKSYVGLHGLPFLGIQRPALVQN